MSKTAIVTGGAKRIGRSVSLKLAELGYNIALHYNRSGTEALQTRRDIEAKGVKCETFTHDLSDTSGIRELSENIFSEFDNIDLLVNNASVFRETSLSDITPAEFYDEFNINLVSPFFLSQQFARRVDKGLIINMLDARITKVHTLHFVYNMTKKSLRDFTLMAAKSLGPGIRVNGICPGPVMPPPDKNQEYLNEIALKTPLKRTGTPSDITVAVKYLVENKYVTGEILYVDGGEHL